MSDKVIGDYTAAITIDGSTHYLLIQPGDSSTAYKKINRNVFLGVTGQPADISSSQNLTNKTLNNTNTITLKDTLFTLQDDGDTTKQAKFQLSGISTGTTRTYTLPDASSTLADIATAQTLTNKTFTAPVINNGSITGTTITTDAIVGQSASTSGTIYGLSIASAKIGSNGVVTASITDAAVTPAKLVAGTGSTWAWTSFTPSYTNLTIGNATVNARYIQIGKTVVGTVQVTIGSSTSITGTYPTFSLPVTAKGSTNGFVGMINCEYTDTGVQNYYGMNFIATGATTVQLTTMNAASTYLVEAGVSSTVPFTFGTGDIIRVSFTYEAA